ncbi:unnamed protein product [Ectocarpus sp. CCAP 1310/34]|nr:unnamed protein product [Ectocarpus sp. CCAP 1310/34]
MKKSATLGRVTLGERSEERNTYGMFEEQHIDGMIGIFITIGLTKKVRMQKNWSRSAHDNYPLVQKCMSVLLQLGWWGRDRRGSKGTGAPRKVEDSPPSTAPLFHVRAVWELEEILNTAWAANVECDNWLSYDEQMIKTVSKYSSKVSFYCPAKPIKHGMKLLAACDITGYCLTSSVDGGMKGDPKLRPYMDCPLGRATRHVLHVLLGECGVLRQKIDGSGVFIAMDNYFTSPTVFECLASYDIFAVGTCRADRTAGADAYLESLGRTIPNRGDMNLCRSGQVACVQWADSKGIFLISTIHFAQPAKGKEEAGGIDHIKPLPLSEVEAKKPIAPGGELEELELASTELATLSKVERAVWDEQKATLLMEKCNVARPNTVELLIREVEAKKPIAPGGELEELELASTELATLSKVERAVWDEQMATLLMAKCNVARPNKGGRRPASDNKPADPVWGSVTLKSGRLCLNPTCKTRSTKGCSCEQFCTRGDESGVFMCETCWKSPESHEQAAKAYWDGLSKGRNRKGFEWQRGSVETAG